MLRNDYSANDSLASRVSFRTEILLKNFFIYARRVHLPERRRTLGDGCTSLCTSHDPMTTVVEKADSPCCLSESASRSETQGFVLYLRNAPSHPDPACVVARRSQRESSFSLSSLPSCSLLPPPRRSSFLDGGRTSLSYHPNAEGPGHTGNALPRESPVTEDSRWSSRWYNPTESCRDSP